MTPNENSRLYGTLNLLVVQCLSEGMLHGLEIAQRIHAVAGDVLRVEEGALYPALHRLERDGLIEAEWGISTKGRRAKFYQLTKAGRRYRDDEVKGWLRHTKAVSRILNVAAE